MSPSVHRYWCIFILIILNHISLIISTSIDASENQYKNQEINCDANKDCNVKCQQPNSCENAHIECPIDYECNVTCSSYNSCKEITINATYSSLFILNDCSSGNNETCSGITIYFPSKKSISSKPKSILRVGNNLNSISNQIQFYAINGWDDIDTTQYFGDFTKENDGKMYCSVNYDKNCNFASNAWSCANTNDICNDYTRFGFFNSFVSGLKTDPQNIQIIILMISFPFYDIHSIHFCVISFIYNDK